MPLNPTNLFIQGAPLPPDFDGTPQEYFEAMLKRMRIVTPQGIVFFVTGSVKPSSDEGPWLKNGTQWWVWDDDAADYVPLDISASLPPLFFLQEDEPESGVDTGLWFRINSTLNRVTGAFIWLGNEWKPLFGNTGTTAERPSNPANLERYYDTDIQCEIWWERGQWRTVAGTVGDVKFVTWPTAEEAMTRNPGWEILGTGDSNNANWRGRAITQATKNFGTSPTTDLGVGAGITKRAQGDLFGAEEHTLTVDELPSHQHSYTTNRSLSADGDGGAGWNQPDSAASSTFNVDATGGDQPHNNIPPSLALWTLRKT